ncbi:hypothetical protein Tco_0105498 [Tanacetum coccineum]
MDISLLSKLQLSLDASTLVNSLSKPGQGRGLPELVKAIKGSELRCMGFVSKKGHLGTSVLGGNQHRGSSWRALRGVEIR